jgi:predicted Zn-dependent peptidase
MYYSPLVRLARPLVASLLFIVSMVTMSDIASAQIDRTKQPEPDPAPKVTFPSYEEFTLRNGLKVFLVRDDRPLVTFRLLVRGGNGLDGDIPGLTDAVAELLTHGTTSRSSLKFAQEIDFIGGSISGSATPDAISVGASGLKKHLPKIVELFADAVKNPSYTADELQKFQQEQISGLASSKARADFLADYAVNKVLYGETPYGQMPSEEGFMKITPEKLKAYHSSYFVPSNATLAFVGNLSKDELQQVLEASFGNWKTGNVPTMRAPSFPDLKGRRIVLVDRPTAVQSALRVVGKGPLLSDKERPMTYILNSILGGGTGLGNRLAMNLRETHAYTYTPYSTFDANYYKGHFVAAADVRNEVTDSALKETLYEIERIQTERVPADELQRNVQSAVGGFLMSVADPSTTAIRVQSIDFYGLPKNYYEKLAGAYNATTSDHVLELAQRYLNKDDLAIVVVGKASEVRSKLEAFGKVEVWNQDLKPVKEVTPSVGSTSMTAQQVWDKMLTAMGGADKLRAVKSLRTTAALETAFGGQKVTGTWKQVEVAPNKVHRVINFGGMFEQTMVVDGSSVRMGQGGNLQAVEGDERDRLLESSHIFQEAYIADQKAVLKMNGVVQEDGKEVYVIELNYPKNGTVLYYIDTKTHLPIKRMTEGEGPTDFADWRKVSGLLLPHKLVVTEPGAEIKMSDFKYEVNAKIDESLFSKK